MALKSCTKTCGVSHAAKCPPESWNFSKAIGPKVLAVTLGIPTISFGNWLIPSLGFV